MYSDLKKPIAIHHTPGSFSDRWLELCQKNSIPYKIVNCYRSDIVEELAGCAGLMWHWSQSDLAAANFARQLTLALETKGFPVFPNSKTAWHFDDKLGQKYLFESLNLPHVPSFSFYDSRSALSFVRSQGLPLVFKLKGGAGSINVRLINNKREARRVINKSFKKGWRFRSRFSSLTQRIWEVKRDRNVTSLLNVLKGLGRVFIQPAAYRAPRLDSGYVYFQEFIPNNDSDIRVVVCNEKAFGFRRMVRAGDFRASGSGVIQSRKEDVPVECVKIAFDAAKKLESQCIAFDFVYRGNEPLIVEISYGFLSETVSQLCPGYWDSDFKWHNAPPEPEKFILQSFLHQILSNSRPS